MTLKASEVSKRLLSQAFYEMNADYCESNSPQFVDDKCARVAFYSARRNLIFRAAPILKNALDSSQSFVARLIYNLKKIGVKFADGKDKPFFIKVGYGHINIKVDGIISSGFPDFPNEPGIILCQTVSGKEFNELTDSQMPYSGYLVNHAQLMMAYGNFKKACIFVISRASGDVFAQVVEINFNVANQIENTTNAGVSANIAPERIIPISTVQTLPTGLASKCASCYFAVHCMLPDSPPPICQNCEHCQIGPQGSVKCMAQNGFDLNFEMQQNLHKCQHHIYRPDILDSWAELIGDATKEGIGEEDIISVKIGNHYANKLTGAEFFNIPEIHNEPEAYSSYEIYGAKGKDLVGDKGIDKLRKVFGAKIQGLDNGVSGKDFSD